ncbi:hypothetical protein Tco_0472729, partial [Tanacetum coccineum]
MEKLENENVSLEFQVQYLNKEIANVKNEYQNLFDSIKKTRFQTQREINELIESVNQKTYAYGDFDKPSFSDKLLCVTPINKNVVQKKMFVSKIKEKQVLTKPVTSQTLPNKKNDVKNNNVIAPGMYKVKTDNKQEMHTQANKSGLTSTSLKGVNSVRRPSSRSSSSKNSVLSNTKIHSEVVEVYAKKNKKTNVTSRVNVVKTKDYVANVDVKNALKANID